LGVGDGVGVTVEVTLGVIDIVGVTLGVILIVGVILGVSVGVGVGGIYLEIVIDPGDIKPDPTDVFVQLSTSHGKDLS
jgi:hypothetical protein